MKTVEEFAAAGCQLSTRVVIFRAIHVRTQGDPCKTGCAYYERGRCPAFRVLFPDTQEEPGGRQQRMIRVRRPDQPGYVRPAKKPFRW